MKRQQINSDDNQFKVSKVKGYVFRLGHIK